MRHKSAFDSRFVNGLILATIFPYCQYVKQGEANTCQGLPTFVRLPWNFKFLYGAVTDAVPIFGSQRKSYMKQVLKSGTLADKVKRIKVALELDAKLQKPPPRQSSRAPPVPLDLFDRVKSYLPSPLKRMVENAGK